MTDVRSWLDVHAAGAPRALRDRMRSALDGVTADRAPDALADAALVELASVLEAPSQRSAALGLLSADALLTAAFAAAADDPDSILQLAQQYDAVRLAALLTP